MSETNTRFALLIPVKTWVRGKTRLAVPPHDRPTLVAAFAYDAMIAAHASPVVASIHVVTDEPDFDLAGLEDTELLPDEGAGDLNEALRAGVRRVRGRTPGIAVAALLADLPALRTADLTSALQAAPSPRWYVADAAGTGTTLLASTGDLDPHFGQGSAAAHLASGATPLDAPLASLRRDVDTAADLAAALELGVGEHTTAALPDGERRRCELERD